MRFLLLLFKIWLLILLFFIIFLFVRRAIEFFKMLAFIKISFFSLIKLSKQEKKELLLAKLNFAQAHNEVRFRFIVANFERFKNCSNEIRSSHDLLNTLILFRERIQKIIYDDAVIGKWKRMFFTAVDDD